MLYGISLHSDSSGALARKIKLWPACNARCVLSLILLCTCCIPVIAGPVKAYKLLPRKNFVPLGGSRWELNRGSSLVHKHWHRTGFGRKQRIPIFHHARPGNGVGSNRRGCSPPSWAVCRPPRGFSRLSI